MASLPQDFLHLLEKSLDQAILKPQNNQNIQLKQSQQTVYFIKKQHTFSAFSQIKKKCLNACFFDQQQMIDYWGDIRDKREQKNALNNFQQQLPDILYNIKCLTALQFLLSLRWLIGAQQNGSSPESQQIDYQSETILAIILLGKTLLDILFVYAIGKVWKKRLAFIQAFLIIQLFSGTVLITEIFLPHQQCQCWLGLLLAYKLLIVSECILFVKLKLILLVCIAIYISLRCNAFQSYISDCCFLQFVLFAIYFIHTAHQRWKNILLNKKQVTDTSSSLNVPNLKKSFYKHCIETIPEGIAVFNKKNQVLFFNSQLLKILNCNFNQIAQHILDIPLQDNYYQSQLSPQPKSQYPAAKFLNQAKPGTQHFIANTNVMEGGTQFLHNNQRQQPQPAPLQSFQQLYSANDLQKLDNIQQVLQVLNSVVQEAGVSNNQQITQKKQESMANDQDHDKQFQLLHYRSNQNISNLKDLSPFQTNKNINNNNLKLFQKRSSLMVVQHFQDDFYKNISQQVLGSSSKLFENVKNLRVCIKGLTYHLRLLKINSSILNNQDTIGSSQPTQHEDCIMLIFHQEDNDQLIKQLILENQQSKQQLSRTAHEFRTPLNCSIVLMERLQSLIPKEFNDDYLQPSLVSIKLLLQLINDLLDYSQIRAGRFSFNFINFKIRKVISSAIQLISIQAELKKIKLIQEIDSFIPFQITSDPNRLRQVILNLLSNALKFTKQGYIKIKVSIYIECPLTLYIQIFDTGIGIKKENQARLFQAFGKINDQENKNLNAQGVGLGLVISNILVRGLGPEMNGGLIVESEYGVGTMFGFLLVDKEDKDLLQLAVESDENIINSSDSDICMYDKNQRKFNSPKCQDFRQTDCYLSENVEGNKDFVIFSNLQQNTSDNNNLFHSQILGSVNDSFTSNNSAQQIIQHSSQSSKFNAHDSLMSSDVLINKINTIHIKKCKCSHFLVVDDNQFNLLMFQKSFQKFLPNIETANSGEEAINKVKVRLSQDCCKNYKIIFMDLEMGEINGYQAIKLIKNSFNNSGTNFQSIIIACSGYNYDDELIRLKENDIKYYLQKPIDRKSLKIILRQIYDDSDPNK